MSGSLKGEKRGGIRRKITKAIQAPKPPAGPGRKKGQVNVATFEAQMEIAQMMGRIDKLPKEVMLEVMNYFYAEAQDYYRVMLANLMAKGETPEQTAAFAEAAAVAQAQTKEMMIISADVAYKAARYVHPSMMAVAQTGGSSSTGDLLDELFRELDQGPRMKVVQQVRKDDAA